MPHYHLYYANAQAEPGSVMTTFPYNESRGGKVPARFRRQHILAKGSLPFWLDHFKRHKIANSGVQERFGQCFIRFSRSAGLEFEVLEDTHDTRQGWSTDQIATG
jgi:glyoxalase family protein